MMYYSKSANVLKIQCITKVLRASYVTRMDEASYHREFVNHNRVHASCKTIAFSRGRG
jgi:hypothetical protein